MRTCHAQSRCSDSFRRSLMTRAYRALLAMSSTSTPAAMIARSPPIASSGLPDLTSVSGMMITVTESARATHAIRNATFGPASPRSSRIGNAIAAELPVRITAISAGWPTARA